MKESRFINQNKEKWLESETLLTKPVKDPEKLSTLFTQVVDDLSYSRTYYPNRSVRVYLNKIARQYFSIIYSHKKERKNRFMLFWLDELPQIILYSRKQLLISLIFFLLAATIGVFSASNDPQFTATILGDSYVAMTNENIEKGDPMAVYKESHQIDMFLGITLNNLMVAFRTYVFGIFLGIGTLAILLYNGIMVGCFQFFFYERSLLVESALTIWLHGTLEISSIIIAGGAGLTLGSGLIFPGTYSRLQAFQLSAMRSLKLMLGITPIFVLAAVIESFLTRYTDAPDALRILLIALSAMYIIGYFVIYPWLKSQRGFDHPLPELRLPPHISDPISYSRLKNNAEILKDTFLFYARSGKKIFPWILMASLGSATASFFLIDKTISDLVIYYSEYWWHNIISDMFYAMKTPTPAFILVNTICTSVVLYRVVGLINGDFRKTPFKWEIIPIIQIILISTCMYAVIYLGGWGIFFLVCSFLLLLLTAFTQLTEKLNVFSAFSKTWNLFRENPKQAFELQFILVFLPFSFLVLLTAPITYMYTEILQWNFSEEDAWAKSTIEFIQDFIKTFSFYLVLPLLAASVSYLYFTLEEVRTAANLKELISKVGIRSSKKNRS